MNTVTENKGYYTNQEMKRADDVRTMQSRVGWPSNTFLKDIILGNQIKNCKPTVDDIVIGNKVYGPQESFLEGKTVRRKPEHSAHVTRVPIPSPLLAQHPTDSVSVDFFCGQEAIFITKI